MTRTRCKLRSSSIILVRLSLLFCFFLVFVVADGDGYGGTNSREAAGSGSAAAAGIRFLTENKNKDDVIKLNSGLQYKILNTNSNSNPNTKQHQQAGRPVRRSVHPTLTSRCVCHYEGRLIDGTIFDASYKRVGRFKAGTPAIFAPDQVIPGWTEALQLMVEGDEWELYIPSQLAYGDRGSPPNIGSGEVLIFQLELLSIEGGDGSIIPASDDDEDDEGTCINDNTTCTTSNTSNPTNLHLLEDGTISSKINGDTGGGGGAAFMKEGLITRLPQIYLNHFNFLSLEVSRGELGKEHNQLVVDGDDKSKNNSKQTILWLHDLPHQNPDVVKAIEEFEAATTKADTFSAIVFVSKWQKSQYEQFFPHIQFKDNYGMVLPNAIAPFSHDTINNKYRTTTTPATTTTTPVSSSDDNEHPTMRLIYHTAPNRGLRVLMHAFVQLYDQKYGNKIHLDVYSSFAYYGWLNELRDPNYQEYFDMCTNHPGCTYHGYQPNSVIREALQQSHIYAYPNTWQETSSLSIIEAMCAGVAVVTSSNGAVQGTLYHTQQGQDISGVLYQYTEEMKTNLNQHMSIFGSALMYTIEKYWDPEEITKRKKLALAAAARYDWGFPGWPEGRIEQWIQFLSALMPPASFNTEPLRSEYNSNEEYAEGLFVYGKRQMILRGNQEGAMQAYDKALRHYNSHSSLLALSLGSLESMGNPSTLVPIRGFDRLVSTLDHNNTEEIVFEPKVGKDSSVHYGINVRAAYMYHQLHYPEKCDIALDHIRSSQYPHDDCLSEILYTTHIPQIPLSQEQATSIVANLHDRIDDLMPRANNLICAQLSFFHLPFPIAYYDLKNIRTELSKVVQLYMTINQDALVKTAPNLMIQKEPIVQRKRETITEQKPLRIGFVSTFFSRTSSIWGNFGRTINLLQQNPLFDVHMIYYPRDPISEDAKTLSLKPETNLYLQSFGLSPDHSALHQARVEIVNRQYDILVYLDMWMTDSLHRLAVSKLAPIQAYTHGHPVTSGIPGHIMDYFISWSAAEQPNYNIAQSYYTEKLVLLPEYPTWEYFEPRTTQDGYSVVGGMTPFFHYTRTTLADEVLATGTDGNRLLKDPNSNLYFCAQAPFKLHFIFDTIIAGIQQQDPNAVIVLIDVRNSDLHNMHLRITTRLQSNPGIDMDQIIFVPRMKHAHLMAMYMVSDVVLDSAYFGGDTTTREAFEVGSPVVTIPHKTIGQRWTYAYYRMMGIDYFIANDVTEYVDIATRHALSDSSHKANVREMIIQLAHEKLYRIEDGVKGWEHILLDIATRPRHWHWTDEEDRM